MGTRGLWGFVVGGKEKLTYNHFDSYPDGLGAGLLKELAERRKLEGWRERLWKEAEALHVVDGQSQPTSEEIERLASFADRGVSTRDLREWYVLLRKTQGLLDATLEAGVMIDSAEFARDSLMCEYAYVLDLDAGRFEAFKGFQDEPHSDGRFAALGPLSKVKSASGTIYYPVRLMGSWPLDGVPAAWADVVDPPEPEENEAAS